MWKRISILFIVVLAVGCKPDYPPEFRYVENLRLAEVNGNTATVQGDAIFYNPNDQKMVLRGVDVDVWIDGKEIGKIEQDEKIQIPASDEFTVPLEAEVKIEDMGIVSTLMNVLGGKKLEIRYKGHVKATMNGLPVKVPVDYTGEVKMR